MYLSSFPPEIWKEILENATTQDLKNISLASPTLCKFSQKRLFSAIVVKGDTRRLEARWKLFTRTVEHSPRLAREVRTIHLSLLDSWNAASILEEFLTHVLPLLLALTKLIVQCSFDFDDIISRHRHLFESAQFSSVLTIHLSNVTNFPLRFLVPFKNLETLVLNEAQFSSETDLPHSLVTLPETLVLIPTRFRELSRFFLFDAGKTNAQARRVDVSRLRNIFLEFLFNFENSPGVLRPIQAVLHGASQHLECLEIFLDPAASFCASSESRCLRFANLQRLSFIAQVSQEDMLRGTESDAHAALTSVVDWIKAVDAREHLQEFHLSPRFRFDGKEAENDQRQMIEISIIPALLDLQAFFTQDKHRIPPRVKISVNCAREEDLAPIRAGLAELETSGLEVNNIVSRSLEKPRGSLYQAADSKKTAGYRPGGRTEKECSHEILSIERPRDRGDKGLPGAMKGDNREPHPILEEGTLPEPAGATATSALQDVLSAGSNGDSSAASFLGIIKDVGRKLSMGGGGSRPRLGSGGNGPRTDREIDSYHSSTRQLESGSHRTLGDGSASLHRAGILQPRSYGAYAPSTSFSSSLLSGPTTATSHLLSPNSTYARDSSTSALSDADSPHPIASSGLESGVPSSHTRHRLGSLNTHSQDGIRQTTMELAQALPGSLVSSSLASGTIGVAGPSSSTAGMVSGGIGGSTGNSRDLGQASGSGGFIFPTSPILESSETGDLPTMGEEGEEGGDRSRPSSELDASLSSLTDFDLESKESLVDAGRDGEISFGKGKKKKEKRKKPSGLSLLRPIGSRSYSSSSSSSTASSRSKERQDVPAITIATSPSTSSRIQEDEDPTPISTPRPLLRPLQGRFDSSLSAASSAMGGMTSENASFYTASSGRTPGVLSPPFAATPSSLAGRELGYTSTPRAQVDGFGRTESDRSRDRAGQASPAVEPRGRGGKRVSFEEVEGRGGRGGREAEGDVDERTPLLLSNAQARPTSPPTSTDGTPNADDDLDSHWYKRFGTRLATVTKPVRDIKLSDIRKRVTVEEVRGRALDVGKGTLKSIPAVLLGCLLNVLDGVSYGMILFPNTPPFTNLGPMGVSMFFVSAIIAQFVYSAGGSGFAGGNGSMMIEVVPFFHILAADIASQIGEDNVKEVIATTLVAYAFSSILTGITFFLLGALKLGVLVGFFPRHILVGCIGGVGVFLIITGFAVSMRLSEDDLSFSLETFRIMFMQTHNLVLWTVPLALAALLRVITAKIRHQLVFPAYFIIIPAIFYVIVLAARLDLTKLRENGWLFDIGADGGREPWWKFYTYYDFRNVHFTALWNTLPTQFALLFFNILHPPLNVPALAVSLDMDVDTNKELVGHGYSNLVSGLFGTVPNYLVYVNTLLFYRVGGETRLASFLLMLATVGLLVIGTGPIAYLPVLVVGALIFVLGIDLVKEALWDTRHRVSRSEYVTILSIMVCMTVWDFVIGVLFGIVVSCFFFVVQNSHRRSIRAVFTGDTAMSAVRRPSVQRAYVREVAKQTTVLRLQGFLFFGTITYVEEAIRDLISGPAYTQNPVRFLVLDFTLVAGVDMSSAEALVRVQRLLSSKCVTLVICGVVADSPVSKSLDSVGLLGAEYVELFRTFNDGMEWTENEYLRAWYRSQKMEVSGIGATAMPVPSRREPQIEFHHPMSGSLVMSPRRTHIRDTGDRTIATEIIARQEEPHYSAEPLNTLTKAFSSYGEVEPRLFAPISDYFNRIIVPAGHVLWRQNDPSDGLYVVESGVLRASYDLTSRPSRESTPRPPASPNSLEGYDNEDLQELHKAAAANGISGGNRRLNTFDESMVAGTVAGELSALSDSPRNATVVVEQPAVLWRLSTRNLDKMQVEKPELARVFVRLVLKAAKVDYDILLTAIAARQ